MMAFGFTPAAQGFTPQSSNLIANEWNAIGFDGAGNAYLFTSYGIKASASAALPGFSELDLVATPGLAYEGGYVAAYVEDDGFLIAEGDAGVTFVDTWDPDSLFIRATLDLGGACWNVAAQHQDSFLVYCGVDGVGMVIVSVEDNTNPTIIGTYADPALAIHEIAYRGDHLYMAADTAGLVVLDVSVPENPTLAGGWSNPGASALDLAFHPAMDSLYIALGNPGLVTIDITDPTNPTLTGGVISTTGAATALSAYEYNYQGTLYYYVMIAEGSAGFEILWTSAVMIASITQTAAPCIGVQANGTTGYAFMGVDGVEIWDVSTAFGPAYIDTYSEPGGARAAFVDGNYAYVANFNAGMTVLDITDPSAPDSLTTVDAEEEYWDVLVNGIYAYALDAVGGLFVYDITDPTTPVAGTPAAGQAGYRDMAIWGDYIYVANDFGDHAVEYFDISTPMAPSLVSGQWISGSNGADDVTISDGMLYASITGAGVFVYDLTDPINPSGLGSYTITTPQGTAVSGNIVYVAAGSEGLMVLDATDPANITSLATVPLSGDAQDVALSGDILYVAHSATGVSSYDVSTPSSPMLISTYDSPGMAYNVALTGTGTALLADGYSLEVYDVGGAGVIVSDPTVRPESFVINGNYPNPFNASTALSFSLPATGQVHIEVFDMMGRMVADLYEGELGIGEHRLLWNAGTVSSGLYFAKVSSPWGQKTQKMVLLK
jgi:hypothetical protein